MAFQSREHSIEFKPIYPCRVISKGKVGSLEALIIRNPYEVLVKEIEGVCYVLVEGWGEFAVEGTLEEIAEKLDVFKQQFEEEFDNWYRNLSPNTTTEHLKLAGYL